MTVDRKDSTLAKATFSTGSYWRSEAYFGQIQGVYRTEVGTASSDSLGPVEAVQVRFDPKRISYPALLRWFWSAIQPTKKPDNKRYQPAVFVHDQAQEKAARRSVTEMEFKHKAELEHLVQTLAAFEPAPPEHQKYYVQNNPRVLQLLKPLFPQREALLESTAVVRINSVLGGCMKPAELRRRWPDITARADEPDGLEGLLDSILAKD